MMMDSNQESTSSSSTSSSSSLPNNIIHLNQDMYKTIKVSIFYYLSLNFPRYLRLFIIYRKKSLSGWILN